MKASILAIGTELTSGQITNKNAATISERLISFGVETILHQTVPDHRRLIRQALEISAAETDLIFVTGGLGPTSDDFTREIISEFTNQTLEFDQKSWDHIVDRLTSRGFKVREDMQKQQCYFPKNSVILNNQNGTAHGFRLQSNVLDKKTNQNRNVNIIVLPGPPREIDSIWKDHLALWLEKFCADIDKKIIKSWDTIGIGESDIAFSVEEVIQLYSKTIQRDIFEIGYRVHLPYVEIKIIYNKKNEALLTPLIESIQQKIQSVTVLKDQEDIIEILIKKITNQLNPDLDFTVYDTTTNGFLNARLQPFFKILPHWGFRQSTNKLDADFFNEEDNFLALIPDQKSADLLEATLIGSVNGKKIQKTLSAPMSSKLMKERRQQYFAEMALIEFCRQL